MSLITCSNYTPLFRPLSSLGSLCPSSQILGTAPDPKSRIFYETRVTRETSPPVDFRELQWGIASPWNQPLLWQLLSYQNTMYPNHTDSHLHMQPLKMSLQIPKYISDLNTSPSLDKQAKPVSITAVVFNCMCICGGLKKTSNLHSRCGGHFGGACIAWLTYLEVRCTVHSQHPGYSHCASLTSHATTSSQLVFPPLVLFS